MIFWCPITGHFRHFGRLFGPLSYLLFLSLLFQCGLSANASSLWPILDNGLQKEIQWDHHSIIINGERLFLFGGEMHPFRLPVPELWEDILQKIKASGMRMVSIYTHWGFHAPTPDTVDFSTGPRNITRFLQMAKDIGLYVTVRPGPHINGELNGGGMALWATTDEYGALRLNGTAYTEAWTPYQDGISQLTRPYQLTEDGTVLMYQIENEYAKQWRDEKARVPNLEAVSYMEKLKENARTNGIVVPLIHNVPNRSGPSWSKDYDTVGAGGNVDIYGLDSYFQYASPKQPSLMPEFQGGATTPWNGPLGGCPERTGVDFVNFYYRDNIAQRVTMLTLYMIYGGTNWGWLAAQFLGSSYDYGAAIAEDRSIGDKYYEIKNLGLFTRVADELAHTERVGTGLDYTNNTDLFTTELRNPDTGAGFYVIRHADTASTSEEWFALKVNTSIGEFFVPKISSAVILSGHEGKILVANFHFGDHTLYYSTAEVLTYSIIDGRPVLVLWTPRGRSGEFYLKGAKEGAILSGPPVTIVAVEHGIIIGYYDQKEDMTVLDFDNGVRVVLVDRKTAYKVWAPALTNDPKVPVDQTALVIGPYLVRSALLTDNTTISLTGDTNRTTPLEVFTSSSITRILWNGIALPTTQTNHSTLLTTIPAPPSTDSFQPPKITSWKSHDALPERHPSYPDTGPAWSPLNTTTTTTNTTTFPLSADPHGFHTGTLLWRGRFPTTPNITAPTGIRLAIQGGAAHGWSAYLNGVYLGSWPGRSDTTVSNLTLAFPEGALVQEENVVLVVQDDTGHEQGEEAGSLRGLVGGWLVFDGDGEGDVGEWRVAGTAGGKRGGLDVMRTIYNEGGLVAERLGWHLPGFDDSDGEWEEGEGPGEGFEGAGVRFYRGKLPLDVPEGVDVSLAFRFTPAEEDVQRETLAYRVLLFVNGWQYGRYYPSISPENTFPVPVGVLNYNGENVVGLAVWALQEEGARVDVEVVVRYVLGSSLDVKFDSSYLRPGWEAGRLEYA
ncbi:glycoside hydrolase superfamily [Chaetomium tenue]|uniref:Glycoside hydrolase superfamily n=1 Tax=Chaetomium tenue TaxID=1854479 RepID=A0ACB7PLP0_9PEZI|nr:glycoside hydrolase superfamily [Chaetomium globosum]